jgi:hypothetical protein
MPFALADICCVVPLENSGNAPPSALTYPVMPSRNRTSSTISSTYISRALTFSSHFYIARRSSSKCAISCISRTRHSRASCCACARVHRATRMILACSSRDRLLGIRPAGNGLGRCRCSDGASWAPRYCVTSRCML